MTPRPHTERSSKCPRSLPARHPPNGAWPAEMPEVYAAAYLGWETTGKLRAAVVRGDAPRPTSSRLRDGKRELLVNFRPAARLIRRKPRIMLGDLFQFRLLRQGIQRVWPRRAYGRRGCGSSWMDSTRRSKLYRRPCESRDP